MTFQDLVDEIGLDEVFLNTSVDVATQNCILEWYFDYELADDNTNTWLRKFRRRINDFYPRYKESVRIMSIKSNMDPFITEFMQTVHNSSDTKNTTFTESNDGSKIVAYGKTSTYTDQNTLQSGISEIETYNNIKDEHSRGVNGIQTTTSYNNVRDEHSRGANGIQSTTTYNSVRDEHSRGVNGIQSTTSYNNYKEDVTGGSFGNSSDTTSGDPQQTTDAVTNTSKGRVMNIAYPEANMGSIGLGVDGGISDIGYASNETRNWGEDRLGATCMKQHLDQLVESEYDDTNESHKTITGSQTVTETGTDANTRTGSQSVTETGTDTSTRSGSQSVTETGTDTNTKTGNKTTTHSGSDITNKTGSTSNGGRDTTTSETDISKTGAETQQGQSAEVYQGRHESAADILPRAIKAIMGSDPVKDLVLEIRVCFDCYARL